MKQYTQERRLSPVLFLMVLGALALLTSCSGRRPASTWFGVAADGDVAYVAANEQVFALDLESGTELWAFPPEPDEDVGSFYATPLLTGDQVVVGSFSNGNLYALPQDGGLQEWTVETGEEASIVEGAVSVDGGLVIGNSKGQVYLIEDQSKRLLMEADEPIWAIPLVDEDKGRVYVACMDHRLYAVDLESGAQLWDFKANGAIAGTPALSDGVLFFGTLASTFYAVDAETGEEQWHVETDGWVWGGPLVHENTVYFGDLSGKLYALDVSDRSERWPPFEAEGGIRVAPLLANDLLYFGTRDKKVYAVRVDDGAKVWSESLDGAVYGQPVISGDYLLLSPHNAKAKLVALGLEGLDERWAYPRREE